MFFFLLRIFNMTVDVYFDETGQIIACAQYETLDDVPADSVSEGVIRVNELPDTIERIMTDWIISNGSFVHTGPKPGEHFKFDVAKGIWEDSRSMKEISEAKWAEIKRKRSLQEFQGFFWHDLEFDSDPLSQQRIQGAVQLATLAKLTNQPFSIEWTLKDNSTRTLSADDMIAVGMALGAHINEQHVRARQLREQIEAATTPEQVQAVRWVY